MKIRPHTLRAAALAALALALPLRALESKTSVQVDVRNGQGTIRLNGEEVWSGTVEGNLTSRSSNVNGEEHAAAFDGDTVLWESSPGAAERVKGMADPGKLMADAMKAQEKAMRRMEKTMRDHASAFSTGGSSFSQAGDDGDDAGAAAKPDNRDGEVKRMKRQGTQGAKATTGDKKGKEEPTGAGNGRKAGESAAVKSGIRIEVKDGMAKAVYNGQAVWSGKAKEDEPVRGLSRSHNGETDAAVLAGDEVLWESSPGAADRLR